MVRCMSDRARGDGGTTWGAVEGMLVLYGVLKQIHHGNILG